MYGQLFQLEGLSPLGSSVSEEGHTFVRYFYMSIPCSLCATLKERLTSKALQLTSNVRMSRDAQRAKSTQRH